MADHSAPPSYDEVVTSPYQHPPPGVHHPPPGVEHPPSGAHLIPPTTTYTPPPAHYPPPTTAYTPPPDVHHQPASATSAVGNFHPRAHYHPSTEQKLQTCANPSAPPEIEMTTVNSIGVTAQTAERLLTNNTVDDVTAAASEDSEDMGP